jgi:hypothetical protein
MKILLILTALSVSVSSVALAATAKQIYNTLETEELSVTVSDISGNMLVGGSLMEKEDGTAICQKRGAVVPNPIYSYECFILIDNIDSEKMYQSLTAKEMYLSFSLQGSPLLGVDTKEKSVGNLMCRAYSFVYHGASPSYSCYIKN